MNRDIPWYTRKSTIIIGICVLVLLCVVWFWRDWVGLGIETQVRFDATNSINFALKQSAYEAPATSLRKFTTQKGQEFYVPDYSEQDSAGVYNYMNLTGIFIERLNSTQSMPLFHVDSIQILPEDTMQYIIQIRYATWLGMSKTVTIQGNPTIPHKKK